MTEVSKSIGSGRKLNLEEIAHPSIVADLKELTPKQKEKLMETMAKYGDDHWWLSKDPVVIGYKQLFERVLIVPFSEFHEGVEKLLGRPVLTHEFGINYDGLKKEAEEAMAQRRAGTFREHTPAEKAGAVAASVMALQRAIDPSRQKVITIPVERRD